MKAGTMDITLPLLNDEAKQSLKDLAALPEAREARLTRIILDKTERNEATIRYEIAQFDSVLLRMVAYQDQDDTVEVFLGLKHLRNVKNSDLVSEVSRLLDIVTRERDCQNTLREIQG